MEQDNTDLNQLKSAWQAETASLPEGEKDMSQIQQIIERGVTSMFHGQEKRLRIVTIGTLALPLLVAVLFYWMSDGFTDADDSVGALLVLTVSFLPFCIFFWSRYRATRQFAARRDTDVRSYLPRAIRFQQRHGRVEIGLMLFFVLLSGIGLVVAVVAVDAVAPPVMLFALALTILVTLRVWSNYRARVRELESYVAQLDEAQ